MKEGGGGGGDKRWKWKWCFGMELGLVSSASRGLPPSREEGFPNLVEHLGSLKF